MLKVRARLLLASPFGMFRTGEVVEVPDDTARAWVASEVADPVGWVPMPAAIKSAAPPVPAPAAEPVPAPAAEPAAPVDASTATVRPKAKLQAVTKAKAARKGKRRA